MLFSGPRQTYSAIPSSHCHAAQPTARASRRHDKQSSKCVPRAAAAWPPAPAVHQRSEAGMQPHSTPVSGVTRRSNESVVAVVRAEELVQQKQQAELHQPAMPEHSSILPSEHAAVADSTVAEASGHSAAHQSQDSHEAQLQQLSIPAPGLPAETETGDAAVQAVQTPVEQLRQHSRPQEPDHPATPRPSYVRRCRTANALIGMLHKHHKSVSPQFWVTALCHLSELLAKGREQIPAHNWSQLERSLLYLADPAAAAQQRKQQRWKQIQQRIQQRVSEGTWVDRPKPRQQQQQEEESVQGGAPLQQQQQHEQANLIQQFTAQQLPTLLWALSKIYPYLTPQQQQQLTVPQQRQEWQLGLPEAFWPAVLHRLTAISDELTPRDVALTLWALGRMRVPMPAGWLNQFIESQTAAMHTYTPQAVALLLHSCARQSVQLQPHYISILLGKVQQDLRRMRHRDLSMILWSLGAMRVQPAAGFMAAAMQASKLHLSAASWPEVAALLAGTARMGFCPSGHWLLELYDQLYWTADQAELRQLVTVIWALGRLRVVAVPQELLERLATFTKLQLQPLLQQQQQESGLQDRSVKIQGSNCTSSSNGRRLQQEQQQGSGLQDEQSARKGPSPDSSSSSAAKQPQEQQPQQLRPDLQDEVPSPDSSDAAKQRYQTAKLLHKLLQGLGRLEVNLSPKLQHEVAESWLPAVLSSHGTLTHVHVPVVLHACAELQIRLSTAVQATVLAKLQQLQPEMSLRGFAVGLRAAIQLGCRVELLWVQQYLSFSVRLLPLASAVEIVMLLRCCVLLKQQPPTSWLQAVYHRVSDLLLVTTQLQQMQGSSEAGILNPQAYGGISGGQLAAVMQHFMELGVHEVPRELLSAAWATMDALEQQGIAVGDVQRFKQAVEGLMASGD